MLRQTLPIEIAAKTGFTDFIKLTYADLTDGDASQVIALLNLNPGDLVVRVATKLVVPFDASDASLISIAIEVGDGGSAARFLASQELCIDGTEIDFKAGTGTALAYLVADTLDATITGTASKLLNTATAGELHIFVAIVRLNAIGDAIV